MAIGVYQPKPCDNIISRANTWGPKMCIWEIPKKGKRKITENDLIVQR